MGTEAAVTGEIPEDAAEMGQRFFNINFGNGDYGSEERQFEMTLEEDYAISGRASVELPTTLMAVFGYDQMPVSVECQAPLNCIYTGDTFGLPCCLEWCISDADCPGTTCLYLSTAVYEGSTEYGVCYYGFGGC